MQVAVYLMNRLPSAAIGGSVPYELLHHKKPTLTHLRVLGCLWYATNSIKGDKFSSRAKPVILLGYSEVQKGYILLDIDSKHWFVS